MVRRVVVVVALLAAILGPPLAPQAEAAKSYRASRYDVTVAVEPGGSLLITERLQFAFGDDTFTYVYRGLSDRHTDGLQVIAVSMDGRPMPAGDTPGAYEIRTRDGEQRLTWHFTPVSRASHVFELTYRVIGVLRREPGRDVLEWRALPAKHDYRIDNATVTVTWPESARAVGPLDAGLNVLVDTDRHSARATRQDIRRDRTWTVSMSFEPGSVATREPEWQVRDQRQRRLLPVFVGIGAALALAITSVFLVFAFNHRSRVVVDRHRLRTTPPVGLPVALGGALAAGGQATWAVAMGTLLDLAHRGHVVIEERPAQGLLKPRGFRIRRAAGPTPLSPTEQALLELTFGAGSDATTHATFDGVAAAARSPRRWKQYARQLSAELQQRGLYDVDRARTRRTATGVAACVIGLGAIGLVAGIPFVPSLGGAPLSIGIALIVAGLICVGAAQSLPTLTDTGRRDADDWQAYARHLATIAKRPVGDAAAARTFTTHLAAAVAFGRAASWAKALKRAGVTEGPRWLHAAASETPGHHFDATVALLSVCVSSGAHSGHAGAGASSGVAGGGSSGAG